MFLYRSRVIVFDVVGFRFCGWDSSCNTLDLGLEFSLVSFRPGAGKTVGGCLHGTREYNEIDPVEVAVGQGTMVPEDWRPTVESLQAYISYYMLLLVWVTFYFWNLRLCVESVEAMNFDCFGGCSALR